MHEFFDRVEDPIRGAYESMGQDVPHSLDSQVEEVVLRLSSQNDTRSLSDVAYEYVAERIECMREDALDAQRHGDF